MPNPIKNLSGFPEVHFVRTKRVTGLRRIPGMFATGSSYRGVTPLVQGVWGDALTRTGTGIERDKPGLDALCRGVRGLPKGGGGGEGSV